MSCENFNRVSQILVIDTPESSNFYDLQRKTLNLIDSGTAARPSFCMAQRREGGKKLSVTQRLMLD